LEIWEKQLRSSKGDVPILKTALSGTRATLTIWFNKNAQIAVIEKN